MQDFDVMWMRCSEDQIEISGQSTNLKFYESYRIDISNHDKAPRIVQHIHEPFQQSAQHTHQPPDGELGISPVKSITVPSTDAEHNYELVFSGHPVSGYCSTTYSKAEIVHLDLHDNITQRVLLYEFAKELCGD